MSNYWYQPKVSVNNNFKMLTLYKNYTLGMGITVDDTVARIAKEMGRPENAIVQQLRKNRNTANWVCYESDTISHAYHSRHKDLKLVGHTLVPNIGHPAIISGDSWSKNRNTGTNTMKSSLGPNFKFNYSPIIEFTPDQIYNACKENKFIHVNARMWKYGNFYIGRADGSHFEKLYGPTKTRAWYGGDCPILQGKLEREHGEYQIAPFGHDLMHQINLIKTYAEGEYHNESK